MPQLEKFDPMRTGANKTPMQCQIKGPWHLGISAESCENAGGKWIRSPCITLKETIDRRTRRFDLVDPSMGSCQDVFGRLETDFVTVATNQTNFPFGRTVDGCSEFCQSLPDHSSQTGMMIKHEPIGSNMNLPDFRYRQVGETEAGGCSNADGGVFASARYQLQDVANQEVVSASCDADERCVGYSYIPPNNTY